MTTVSVDTLSQELGVDAAVLQRLSREQLARLQSDGDELSAVRIVQSIERDQSVSDTNLSRIKALSKNERFVREFLSLDGLTLLSGLLSTDDPNAFPAFLELVSSNLGIEKLSKSTQALQNLFRYVMRVDAKHFCAASLVLGLAISVPPGDRLLLSSIAIGDAENFGRQFAQLAEGLESLSSSQLLECTVELVSAFLSAIDELYQRQCLREELERYNFSETLRRARARVENSKRAEDARLWLAIDRYTEGTRRDQEAVESRFRDLLSDGSSSTLESIRSNLASIYANRVNDPRLFAAANAAAQLFAQLSFSRSQPQWLNAYAAMYNVGTRASFWSTCSAKAYSPSTRPLFSLADQQPLDEPSAPKPGPTPPPEAPILLPPPPLAPGGPPPPMPPPPPAAAVVRKPKIQPPESNVKLRNFQWQKIPPTAPTFDASVFEPFDAIDDVRVDAEQLEELFGPRAKAETKEEQEQGTRPEETRQRPEAKLQVFSPKKSNIVLIFLAGFRGQSEQEVLQRIRAGDITADQVAQIKQMLPVREELEAMLSSETEQLAEAETFALALVQQIPDILERLAILDYALPLRDDADIIDTLSQQVSEAADSIVQSTAFADILRTILRLGNFLNQKTPKGDAFAFDVGSLSRLADTKSPSDPGVSLLSYLVRFVNAESPEREAFLEQLSADLESQQQADVRELGALFAQLSARREAAIKAYGEISEEIRTGQEQDPLLAAYAQGIERTPELAQHYDRAQKSLERARKSIAELFAYFGLDPAKTSKTGLEIMRIVGDFRAKYARALVALRESKIREEKQALLEQETSTVVTKPTRRRRKRQRRRTAEA